MISTEEQKAASAGSSLIKAADNEDDGRTMTRARLSEKHVGIPVHRRSGPLKASQSRLKEILKE